MGAADIARHLGVIDNKFRISSLSSISGKKGIIYFDEFHIDLFDGSQLVGNGPVPIYYQDKPMFFMELEE